MAIEKGIYAAPESIEDVEVEEADMEADLSIEIVDPEMVTLSDGSMEITLIPDANETDLMAFDANLVDALDEGLLNELSGELIGMVDADVDSRKDWAETYVKGLDILGFKYEERTTPWQGACGVNSTVLAEQLSGSKQRP